MNALYLDLASAQGTLALCTEEAVVCLEQLKNRATDAEIKGCLESSLDKAGWKHADLTHIACVLGPGGFTSLRMATSWVNGLGYGLNIPKAGIHLSEVYGERLAISDERLALWLHSTKKELVFVRQSSENEPVLMELDELKEHLVNHTHFMGELIPEHREIVEDAGLVEAELTSLEEVLPGLVSSLDYSEDLLQPWYGRGW